MSPLIKRDLFDCETSNSISLKPVLNSLKSALGALQTPEIIKFLEFLF